MRKYLAVLMLLVPSLSFGQGVKYILDESSQVRPSFMTASNTAVIAAVILSNQGSAYMRNVMQSPDDTEARRLLNLPWSGLTNTNQNTIRKAIGIDNGSKTFLRTSGKDNSGNDNGGIVSAFSPDGVNWTATRNYSIFPSFARDASTIRYSNNWVSVYTEAFNSTNKAFGLATSTNLLSWQTNFLVKLTGTSTIGTANNVWAPEWFVDGTNYYVLVRLSTTTNNNYGAPGMGYMRCLDPGTWTNWSSWTPFPTASVRTDANDFYIVKNGSLYWLFSHGGTHLSGKQPAGSNIVNNITLQYSTNPFQNYSSLVEITEPLRAIINPGSNSAFFEGPSVVNVDGSHWKLFFQDGLNNTAWVIDSYDNFLTWDTNTIRRLNYSGFDGGGHGTVVALDVTNVVGAYQAILGLGTKDTIGLGASWLTNSTPPTTTTNATNLVAGTLADARLSTNVAILSNLPTWATTTNSATARTNLLLGASWLTNTNVTNFVKDLSLPTTMWTNPPASNNSTGTAGQVAYTNNYFYIAISNNTWRRVQIGTW